MDLEQRIQKLETEMREHHHDGVVGRQVYDRNLLQAIAPIQFSQTVDYTSTQTVIIKTGFVPRTALFNGYAVNLAIPKYSISTGFAGRTSPTAGMNNYFDITAGPTITVGTGLYLGGNTIAYCYISAWNPASITLEVVCPAGWTLSTNIMIS